MSLLHFSSSFFFNDTPTTEIYTLSLHDALPIWLVHQAARDLDAAAHAPGQVLHRLVRPLGELDRREQLRDQPLAPRADRKSTRLNSSHPSISYAVFCLKKKKKTTNITRESNITD